MLDDLDRMRNNPRLLELLTHYGNLGKEDRETWQDRLMRMEGVESPELSRWHGELIAFGWVDQNTGQVPVHQMECVPACYRITSAGLRAIRQLTFTASEGDNEILSMPEQPKGWPGKKRKKAA